MKIALIKSINCRGVILQAEKYISDAYLEVETEESGTLVIGAASRSLEAGKNFIRESDVAQGINAVTFIADDGARYSCGYITRSGRAIAVANETADLTVSLAKACDEQAKEIKALRDEFNNFKTQFGVSII